MPTVDPQRRRLVTGGAVASAALWAAPSVTTFGRVSAATGSCGTAPVQIDWSDQPNNSTPGTVTANDGTHVSFALTQSPRPAAVNNFRVRHITRGALTDMLYLQMSGNTVGNTVQVQIDFTRPVDLCFTLIDVDRSEGRWEDTVMLEGSNGGSPVDLGAADLLLAGTGATYLGPNTVRGVYDVGGTSAAANVDVRYPAAVDRVVITYTDVTGWTTTQFVGIHDLRWC